MTTDEPDVERILGNVATQYRGPGGAVAVLRAGEVVKQFVWGYADLERRIPLTASTLFPICSISKQMVCLAMADLEQRPTSKMIKTGGDIWDQLSPELSKYLPHLTQQQDNGLKVEHLFNMCSGIRDYWAMTTLWGGKPDDPFSLANDAPEALKRTKSFHFTPGAEYSYSNVNFHVLGRMLEDVSGQSLGQLLSQRVFIPAGMTTAALQPNTNAHPLPIVGYEFDEKKGHMSALNRIEWSGDAGIVASLNDMIAYEKWIDSTHSDPQSIYSTIAKGQLWNDGSVSKYAFGLKRGSVGGKVTTGHGGGLRGFTLRREHVPSERLSVVVMFNHHAGAAKAATKILKQILRVPEPEPTNIEPEEQWLGDFLDDLTQLVVTVKKSNTPGKLSIKYARAAETVTLTDATNARSDSMIALFDADSDMVFIKRLEDNRTLEAHRIASPGDAFPTPTEGGFAGVYHCEESESTFHCTGEGGIMYGAFDGYLGKGQMLLMRYVGSDVWALANPRAMDAAPPGDWTIVFRRKQNGVIDKVTIGCWLARRLEYVRVE